MFSNCIGRMYLFSVVVLFYDLKAVYTQCIFTIYFKSKEKLLFNVDIHFFSNETSPTEIILTTNLISAIVSV